MSSNRRRSSSTGDRPNPTTNSGGGLLSAVQRHLGHNPLGIGAGLEDDTTVGDGTTVKIECCPTSGPYKKFVVDPVKKRGDYSLLQSCTAREVYDNPQYGLHVYHWKDFESKYNYFRTYHKKDWEGLAQPQLDHTQSVRPDVDASATVLPFTVRPQCDDDATEVPRIS